MNRGNAATKPRKRERQKRAFDPRPLKDWIESNYPDMHTRLYVGEGAPDSSNNFKVLAERIAGDKIKSKSAERCLFRLCNQSKKYITWVIVDEICCGLGIHPYSIYGEDWLI